MFVLNQGSEFTKDFPTQKHKIGTLWCGVLFSELKT